MEKPQSKMEVLTDAPLDSQMKIKKNYVKPSLVEQEKATIKKADEQKTQKCPKCGMQVKVAEWR